MKTSTAILAFFLSQSTFSQTISSQIIENKGFNFESLYRGLIGMIVLIVIAFLLSNNKKAIKWKSVGIGLIFQLIIAIGVLKVDFVMKAFEYVGQGFIAIPLFTQAGTKFLFGNMLNVDSFGYILSLIHISEPTRPY